AVDVNLPDGAAALPDAARVDVDDGGAVAELAGHGGHDFRRADGGGVDADLFRSGLDQPRGVVQRADAAADGEGHEDLFRDAPHHVEQDLPALVAGADVEEDQLVGAVGLVAARHLDGVAGVAQLEEIDTLDHTAAVHVQAGDDALGEHAAVNLPRGAQKNRGPAVASHGRVPLSRW